MGNNLQDNWTPTTSVHCTVSGAQNAIWPSRYSKNARQWPFLSVAVCSIKRDRIHFYNGAQGRLDHVRLCCWLAASAAG